MELSMQDLASLTWNSSEGERAMQRDRTSAILSQESMSDNRDFDSLSYELPQWSRYSVIIHDAIALYA